MFEPTAEFRAGGCAASTQSCSGKGLRTPNDGYQNSFAELALPHLEWVTPRGAAAVVGVQLEGCDMTNVRRTRTPTTFVSFVSLVLELGEARSR